MINILPNPTNKGHFQKSVSEVYELLVDQGLFGTDGLEPFSGYNELMKILSLTEAFHTNDFIRGRIIYRQDDRELFIVRTDPVKSNDSLLVGDKVENEGIQSIVYCYRTDISRTILLSAGYRLFSTEGESRRVINDKRSGYNPTSNQSLREIVDFGIGTSRHRMLSERASLYLGVLMGGPRAIEKLIQTYSAITTHL